jgi:phosphate transport system substrate-binding protein
MLRSPLKHALYAMCAFGALATGYAASASATTTLFGGGSSLAALVYDAQFATYSALVDPTTGFTYASRGSGAGQTAFFNNAVPSSYLNTTPATQGDYGSPVLNGAVSFGASDATLNPTGTISIASWSDGTHPQGYAVSGPLLQLPTFGTPIAVVFNLKASGQSNNGGLKLTDPQICGIFSGKITTWNDPALAGITSVGTAPSGTINVVFRLDNSGTTFLFTNHLKTVCTSSEVPASFTHTDPVSGLTVTNFGYNNPTPTVLSGGGANNASGQDFSGQFTNGTLPANITAAPNSNGIQAYVETTSNSIGYLSPDFTSIAAVNQGTSLPTVAAVKNTNNGVYYLPSVKSTIAALATYTLPTDSTAQFVDYVPLVPNPASNYPIAGFTTWDVASCYANATVGTDAAGFLSAVYGSNLSVANQLSANGFAELPSALSNLIKTNVFNAGGAHQIDSAAVCTGFTGR